MNYWKNRFMCWNKLSFNKLNKGNKTSQNKFSMSIMIWLLTLWVRMIKLPIKLENIQLWTFPTCINLNIILNHPDSHNFHMMIQNQRILEESLWNKTLMKTECKKSTTENKDSFDLYLTLTNTKNKTQTCLRNALKKLLTRQLWN